MERIALGKIFGSKFRKQIHGSGSRGLKRLPPEPTLMLTLGTYWLMISKVQVGHNVLLQVDFMQVLFPVPSAVPPILALVKTPTIVKPKEIIPKAPGLEEGYIRSHLLTWELNRGRGR